MFFKMTFTNKLLVTKVTLENVVLKVAFSKKLLIAKMALKLCFCWGKKGCFTFWKKILNFEVLLEWPKFECDFVR